MPTFVSNSIHTAYVTVNNAGGPAQVMVRGMVKGSADGSNVVDSAVADIASNGQAEIALGSLTMPGTPGVYALTVEVYWRYADGTGTWTLILGPSAAGEAVTIAAPVVPPSLSIAGVRWS